MGRELVADGLMMMFMRGMAVDYGDQVLMFRDERMWLGGEVKKTRERQQDEKKVQSILARIAKMMRGIN